MKIIWNRYTVMGLIAILLWSMTVALVRSISEQVGPITAGSAVYLVGGILSMVIYFAKKDGFHTFKKVSRIYLFGCGALFIIYTIALFMALGMAMNRYQTLELGLINYLWPALTILFSLFFLSRKASLWLMPGTLLAMAGIFFVTTSNLPISGHGFIEHVGSNPIAYGLSLIAAISWAIYSNLTRLAAGDSDGGAVPFFIMVTGIVLLIIRFFFPENGVWTFKVAMEIVVLGIVTSLAYIFWDASMRKGEMILVVAFSYLTPFFSTVFASVYLNIIPKSSLWLGCAMIIIGSFISWRSIKVKSENKYFFKRITK